MEALKGSRAGLAVAVAGMGIGIAIIVDSVLAEKRYSEKKRQILVQTELMKLQSNPDGEEYIQENLEDEEEEAIQEEEEEKEEDDDCPNCAPEAIGATLRNIEDETTDDDDTKMKPGEGYAEWYERQRENAEKKRLIYSVDTSYKGDGSEASRRLYLIKKAYFDSRAAQEDPPSVAAV
jgi:hypothetical protein